VALVEVAPGRQGSYWCSLSVNVPTMATLRTTKSNENTSMTTNDDLRRPGYVGAGDRYDGAATEDHGTTSSSSSPRPPSSYPFLLLRRASKALLLLAISFATIVASSLLFGHVAYPSSPLMSSLPTEGFGEASRQAPSDGAATRGCENVNANNATEFCADRPSDRSCAAAADDFGRRCRLRLELSSATLSFVLATSLRTTILAPLMRMQREKQSPLSPLVDGMDSIAGEMERYSHGVWEDAARRSNVMGNEGDRSSSFTGHRDPPEIDLNVPVPCERDAARIFLLERKITQEPHSNDNLNGVISTTDYDAGEGAGTSGNFCRLRDIITRRLLVEYVRAHYDEEFDLATHPLILRNAWPPESFDEGNIRRLTPKSILNDPQLSDLLLPNFFSDATKTGYDALVPDEDQIALSQFVKGILSGRTPNAKIGTQVIVERIPELRDEIVPPSLARELFGWTTWLDDWKKSAKEWLGPTVGGWIDKLPDMSAYPVFIASNRRRAAEKSSSGNAHHPRTDLHNEPIGNVASQLHGTRRWTLVPAKWSGLLRPAVSKRRGYFYSDMDPLTELPQRLGDMPQVYECTTRRGDIIWIPPWVWHRVDYDGEDGDGDESELAAASYENLSIGASIFHFYPLLYLTNFPLFGFLIVPNLIREFTGFNVE